MTPVPIQFVHDVHDCPLDPSSVFDSLCELANIEYATRSRYFHRLLSRQRIPGDGEQPGAGFALSSERLQCSIMAYDRVPFRMPR